VKLHYLIEDFYIYLYLVALGTIKLERGRSSLVFKANSKQLLALLWTLVSVVVSLIVVLSLGYFPYFTLTWQTATILFFAVFLVMTLPIYLLLAVWHMLSEKVESEG
jgi:hypothetical protein